MNRRRPSSRQIAAAFRFYDYLRPDGAPSPEKREQAREAFRKAKLAYHTAIEAARAGDLRAERQLNEARAALALIDAGEQ